jgi:hypothetical protein
LKEENGQKENTIKYSLAFSGQRTKERRVENALEKQTDVAIPAMASYFAPVVSF